MGDWRRAWKYSEVTTDTHTLKIEKSDFKTVLEVKQKRVTTFSHFEEREKQRGDQAMLLACSAWAECSLPSRLMPSKGGRGSRHHHYPAHATEFEAKWPRNGKINAKIAGWHQSSNEIRGASSAGSAQWQHGKTLAKQMCQ